MIQCTAYDQALAKSSALYREYGFPLGRDLCLSVSRLELHSLSPQILLLNQLPLSYTLNNSPVHSFCQIQSHGPAVISLNSFKLSVKREKERRFLSEEGSTLSILCICCNIFKHYSEIQIKI